MNEYRKLTRNDFDHKITVLTRWADMDALGHLNHIRYLTYMETARVDYYTSLGFGEVRRDQNPSMILGGMKIQYIHQVSHPAALDIFHRINRVGTKSFDYLGAIFLKDSDHPVCTGIFHIVTFDYKNQKTVVVPQIIRDRCWPNE